MLAGQLSFDGIPGPAVQPEPVPMMDARQMVELIAQLPPRKVSTPEEVRARIEARMADSERQNRRCSTCGKRLQSIVAAEMHIRDLHGGRGFRVSVYGPLPATREQTA